MYSESTGFEPAHAFTWTR